MRRRVVSTRGRIALRSARPRDLAQLRNALDRLPTVHGLVAPLDAALLQTLARDCSGHPELAGILTSAIVESPPVTTRDGGMLAEGYDAELDELRSLSENADEFLQNYETQQREDTAAGVIGAWLHNVVQDVSEEIAEIDNAVQALGFDTSNGSITEQNPKADAKTNKNPANIPGILNGRVTKKKD